MALFSAELCIVLFSVNLALLFLNLGLRLKNHTKPYPNLSFVNYPKNWVKNQDWGYIFCDSTV